MGYFLPLQSDTYIFKRGIGKGEVKVKRKRWDDLSN